jgi:hypothetical protein
MSQKMCQRCHTRPSSRFVLMARTRHGFDSPLCLYCAGAELVAQWFEAQHVPRQHCLALHRDGPLCTLKPGHTGKHLAHGTHGTVIAQWFDEDCATTNGATE